MVCTGNSAPFQVSLPKPRPVQLSPAQPSPAQPSPAQLQCRWPALVGDEQRQPPATEAIYICFSANWLASGPLQRWCVTVTERPIAESWAGGGGVAAGGGGVAWGSGWVGWLQRVMVAGGLGSEYQWRWWWRRRWLTAATSVGCAFHHMFVGWQYWYWSLIHSPSAI